MCTADSVLRTPKLTRLYDFLLFLLGPDPPILCLKRLVVDRFCDFGYELVVDLMQFWKAVCDSVVHVPTML